MRSQWGTVSYAAAHVFRAWTVFCAWFTESLVRAWQPRPGSEHLGNRPLAVALIVHDNHITTLLLSLLPLTLLLLLLLARTAGAIG